MELQLVPRSSEFSLRRFQVFLVLQVVLNLPQHVPAATTASVISEAEQVCQNATSVQTHPHLTELCKSLELLLTNSTTYSEVPVIKTDIYQMCQNNADLGRLAVPEVTKICKALNLPVPDETEEESCIPIPPRNDATVKITEINKALSDGISKINGRRGSAMGDKAVFVLGNTGSGKSTATQVIAGNLSRLYATKTEQGVLVIIDEDQTIGAPTTKSVTLVPEYVVNSRSGVSFWDLPGFDDNRGPEVDIAAMLFLKYVMDTTTEAKFLFTIGHTSLLPTSDRLIFDLLATHATRLIRNIPKYADSIGLVATKVIGFSPSTGEPFTDSEIIGQIQEFFQIYLKDMSNDLKKAKDESDRSHVQSKIDFVKAILGEIGSQNISRLYILRSPTKCGVLGTMESVLQTREKLTELYSKNLTYSPVMPNDFSFTLKETTLSNIRQTSLPKTIKEIKNSVNLLVRELNTQFSEKLHDQFRDSTEDRLEYLNDVHLQLQEINETSSRNEVSDHLHQLFIRLNYSIDDTKFSQLKNLESQLRFFNKVINEDESIIQSQLESSRQQINSFTDMVENLTLFYKLCQSTEQQLVKYKNQLQMAALSKLLTEEEELFRDENVLQFLEGNKFVAVPKEVTLYWVKNQLAGEDKMHLIKLVKQLAPSLKMKCDKSYMDIKKHRLVISGQNVLLSDVINEMAWPVACKNDVKELSVVALERLYLDIDMMKTGSELQVSMVAPIWEVVLNQDPIREINLDGSQPSKPAKAANGEGLGDRGKDGESGSPGGNAGAFLGIYSKIENGVKLLISVNGGDGGDGGDAGDGMLGANGENATWAKFPGPLDESAKKKLDMVMDSASDQTYTLKGDAGKKGGDGGNGGQGGSPGMFGTVKLVPTTRQAVILHPQLKQTIGSNGTGGLGGKGARGGNRGNDYYCSIRFPAFWWVGCGTTIHEKDWGPSGSNGENGGTPEPPSGIPTPVHDPWRAVDDFRTSFFAKKSKLDFWKVLDSDLAVLELINPKSFAKELESVENQYYQMSDMGLNSRKDAFLSYYDSFLMRMRDYVNTTSNLTDLDKIILNVLYTTALSKIVGLRTADHRLNVINTKEYFDALTLQMNNLAVVQKDKVVQEAGIGFRDNLKAKEAEAQSFITKTVQPAIKEVKVKVQKMNDQLLKEINDYITEAEVDVEKEKQAKRDFQSSLSMKGFMEVLNMAGTVTQFMGPFGMAAGGIMSAVSSTAKSFMPYPNPNDRPRASLAFPSTVVKMFGDEKKEYFEDKLRAYEKQMELVRQAAEQISTEADAEIKALAKKAEQVQAQIDDIRQTTDRTESPMDIVDLEAQLDNSMKEMREAFDKKDRQITEEAAKAKTEEEKEAAKEKERKVGKWIKRCVIGMQFVDAVGGFISTQLETQDELERLDNLIKAAEEKAKAWNDKKDKFYTDFLPSLKSINGEIDRENSNLEQQSQVALSVKKWKIKDLLTNMKTSVKSFAKDLESDTLEVFQVCIDKMDAAFTLLVDLFDHMERYEERLEFADFIASVNSENGDVSIIKAVDSELGESLTNLKFSIKANSFLEQFEKGLYAFKQWVFPFASHYLPAKKDVSGVIKTGKLDAVVNMYKEEIQMLTSQLAMYKATTDDGDETKMISVFTSDLISTKPFYVWSNDLWRDSIKKLLAGHAIQLKADVNMVGQKSEQFFKGKSAIKFKTVELVLKTRNVSRQGVLDEKMKYFQMAMSHSGISVYKMLGNNYMMMDKNQTYRYNFEKTDEGHVAVNGVKFKVDGINADYMMSPYTWWTFQITDAVPGEGVELSDLAEFENEINLKLEGKGLYINELESKNQLLKDLNLKDYYEVYDDSRI